MIKYLILFFLMFCSFFYADETSNTELKLYLDLPLTQSQEKDIDKLITTLANTSTFGLMFKQSELEDIGKRIYGVHPLRYIGYIFESPKLKKCMIKLMKKSIVSSRFMKELSNAFNRTLNEGQLKQYLPGFADSLHLDLPPLIVFVDKRDWQGLLDYLY